MSQSKIDCTRSGSAGSNWQLSSFRSLCTNDTRVGGGHRRGEPRRHRVHLRRAVRRVGRGPSGCAHPDTCRSTKPSGRPSVDEVDRGRVEQVQLGHRVDQRERDPATDVGDGPAIDGRHLAADHLADAAAPSRRSRSRSRSGRRRTGRRAARDRTPATAATALGTRGSCRAPRARPCRTAAGAAPARCRRSAAGRSGWPIRSGNCSGRERRRRARRCCRAGDARARPSRAPRRRGPAPRRAGIVARHSWATCCSITSR